ncbi:ARM repeat superfamily protein [Actinidia rufa]|uniref:ARM repeat superfamily protein n=1 Tax=Actinidia rufa TaxID=165716 RepID=A0A7J0E8Y5_9ERIC|nr:ARM repeat superfamily protein [Actinidia rufa]
MWVVLNCPCEVIIISPGIKSCVSERNNSVRKPTWRDYLDCYNRFQEIRASLFQEICRTVRPESTAVPHSLEANTYTVPLVNQICDYQNGVQKPLSLSRRWCWHIWLDMVRDKEFGQADVVIRKGDRSGRSGGGEREREGIRGAKIGWHLWQSDLQTILHGFSLLTQNTSSNASELHQDDLYLTCERWLLCTKIIRQLIISGFPIDAKLIQEVRPVKEVSPVLLSSIQSFLPYYSTFWVRQPKFWDFLKGACTKLMKVLVAVQSRHPYSFGDKSVLSPVMDFCLIKITDPGPDIMSFEQFLIQCMKLVKCVLECKEYKPSMTGRVTDESGVSFEQMKKNVSSAVAGVVTSLLPSERVVFLCNVLIRRYFVLTATDMEAWYQNPESFHHEQDSVLWSEKLRPCAEALYIVLFENHSQLLGPVVVSIVHEAMNGCPASVSEITPGLLLKDAAYGAAAYVYYELSNYLSFKEWFNGALALELTNDHPNMRIIHRKVALILGQWVSEIKDDTRRPVYCALIKLLQDSDLCVRLAASRSLCFLIEDANFSEKDFSDLLPICWDLCFKLVEEVQEFDSKVKLLMFHHLVL